MHRRVHRSLAVYLAYQEAECRQSATKQGGGAICELNLDPPKTLRWSSFLFSQGGTERGSNEENDYRRQGVCRCLWSWAMICYLSVLHCPAVVIPRKHRAWHGMLWLTGSSNTYWVHLPVHRHTLGPWRGSTISHGCFPGC